MSPEPAAPTRLELRHSRGATPVLVGAGVLRGVVAELEAALAGRTVFAVTTPRVRELHGEVLERLARPAGRLEVLEVEEGEAAKRVAKAEELWRRMLELGGRRDSRVVAFGGGSVGDLAGFVAGTFLRGIPYLQLPTTLLAQVDAAIGGKTAVDLPEAKNSVGLFHQPALVVCDTDLLRTLPAAELRAGLFEVVKVAALVDAALFDALEKAATKLLDGDPETRGPRLAPLVAAAARAKIAVVEGDVEDRGGRRLLNFGHTLGHALEAAAGYRGLRHGEAVAYGMLFALRLAAGRGLPADAAERVRRLIAGLGLPPLPRLDPEELLALVERDKKATAAGVVWVLPGRPGEGALIEPLPRAEVRRQLASFLAAPLAAP